MGICGDYGPLDFRSSCIRASWSAFLPTAVVFGLCFVALPIPKPARRAFSILGSPFKPFVTLQEAEALDVKALGVEEEEEVPELPTFVPLWRTVLFVFVGIVECFCWTAAGAYGLYNHNDNPIFPFLVALSWLYTAIRPIARPAATPPYGLFAIYLVLFITSILQIGGFLFDHGVSGLPYPSTLSLVAHDFNLLAILLLLILTVNMPLAVPSSRVNKKEIVSDTNVQPHWDLLSSRVTQ